MLPTSTTIQNDLRKLEMLRQKQIEEIEGMLQNQLSLEETRNKNNLKMQKQIEKEQKQHREKMILAQEEKKRIIIKETDLFLVHYHIENEWGHIHHARKSTYHLGELQSKEVQCHLYPAVVIQL